MHEEERARHVRIVELAGLLDTEPSATPLPWPQPSHPRSLLASFGSDTSLACPRKLSDRQMLECLHVFTSHHLKALQGVDAKYRSPKASSPTRTRTRTRTLTMIPTPTRIHPSPDPNPNPDPNPYPQGLRRGGRRAARHGRGMAHAAHALAGGRTPRPR